MSDKSKHETVTPAPGVWLEGPYRGYSNAALIAFVRRGRAWGVVGELADRLEAAEAKLDKVRALHKGPTYFHPDLTLAEPHEVCQECIPLCECAEVYPCPTVQALGENEHE